MRDGRQVVFSDVDGTLVHLARDLQSLGSFTEDGLHFSSSDGGVIAVRALPPSSTGLQGYISERTLELVAELRLSGHLFVLISGARSTTIFERLPFLPAADAYVTENGGRIFFPVEAAGAPTAAPIMEDEEWRSLHAAAGPAAQGSVPPAERSGELWDLYRSMKQDGWECDANRYSTSFRVGLSKSAAKTAADLQAITEGLPATLAASCNLGAADIYPATSGKDMAAQYLMRKFGVGPEATVSMGDDDNDLALAAIVRHTYVPGFTADSVRAAVAADPAAFTVSEVGGFAGTNELLARIAFDLGRNSYHPWPGHPRMGTVLPFAALMLIGYAFMRSRRRRGF
mmetsp:Transcript_114185/g.333823  ORF Transcript_114185/g.333823 Transcript_114185/m.333823 type:complete len:342 (-) Transcript_114185:133-1158(-)